MLLNILNRCIPLALDEPIDRPRDAVNEGLGFEADWVALCALTTLPLPRASLRGMWYAAASGCGFLRDKALGVLAAVSKANGACSARVVASASRSNSVRAGFGLSAVTNCAPDARGAVS